MQHIGDLAQGVLDRLACTIAIRKIAEFEFTEDERRIEMRRPRPPTTEPVAIPCLFVSEVEVIASDGHVRLIGIVDVPAMGGGTAERRIVARLVLTFIAARSLESALQRVTGKAH